MKQFLLLAAIVLAFSSCSTNKVVVQIPANDLVEMNMNTGDYIATLDNKTFGGVDVAVIDQQSREQRRGFGLGVRGKADVLVEETSTLVLRNNNNQTARVIFRMSDRDPQEYQAPAEGSVSFTLRNTTAQSIPLLIPNVMNPNLSPYSRSGVNLAYGQEILFKENGRKYILLVVDEQIAPGSEINVAQLLKLRKEELGL